MAKAQRSSSSSRYVLTPALGNKPATLRNRETGEVLVLHGYGASKGKFEVKKGIDLTKPIFEQVLKMEMRKKRKASAKRRAPKD